MNNLADIMLGRFGENAGVVLALLVFLPAALISFWTMSVVRVRGAIKRRAAGIMDESAVRSGGSSRSLRHSSVKAAQRMLEYTAKHYTSANNNKDMKLLRRRLVLAGIYDQRAVGIFFVARTALAVCLAAAVFFGLPILADDKGSSFWLIVGFAGMAGYIGPSFYLSRRIAKRRDEHRAGFPDFMDLLVVCADSGLSMEAALGRVGRELADSFPSLSTNIHMATLEIRAGRTSTEALEHLGDRLGLDEARSFATLIQQSEELGSSVTDALRVYSDDMRHKRLSRAEEKAYSLPVKLSLPMMICIFPVIFVVILLPVFVRLKTGAY
jgi:tight adherence protein C